MGWTQRKNMTKLWLNFLIVFCQHNVYSLCHKCDTTRMCNLATEQLGRSEDGPRMPMQLRLFRGWRETRRGEIALA